MLNTQHSRILSLILLSILFVSLASSPTKANDWNYQKADAQQKTQGNKVDALLQAAYKAYAAQFKMKSASAGLRDNNLIEFSQGAYANMSTKAMLLPPFVKIYQDGKVIHYDSDGEGNRPFYVSQLDPNQLDSLKKFLAGEKYLWRSRFIDMEGDDINVHGGVSYIRYLDGDKEILLATEVKPRGGPWKQLTDAIFKYVPEDHENLYYPSSLLVDTWLEESEFTDQNPDVWSFSKQLKLTPKLKTISDPEIVHFLFDRLNYVFSFFVWDFKDNGKRYSIALVGAPGWFEPEYINEALAKVKKNGYRVQEK